MHLAHDILTEKYKNPPTVHELSEQVSLSMQKLNYAFLHEYDTTISDYIISLKMEYGAKLLSETLLGIDEIALQCGYHYPANFIRMFKKILWGDTFAVSEIHHQIKHNSRCHNSDRNDL